MQKTFFVAALLFILADISAQTPSAADSLPVQRACFDYIEGFYEGDTLKLQRCLSPTLYKYGYWKNKEGQFNGDQMTYAQAIEYGKEVLTKKSFAKADAPKKVQLMDVQAHIACAKITAWWGLDYALLSRKDGVWKIEQVLWQGPYKSINQ